jgi:hypothetical protein
VVDDPGLAPVSEATAEASQGMPQSEGLAADAMVSERVIQLLPVLEPLMYWTSGNALALLGIIEESVVRVCFLWTTSLRRRADVISSRSFSWLAEDLREGRTPMTARVQ